MYNYLMMYPTLTMRHFAEAWHEYVNFIHGKLLACLKRQLQRFKWYSKPLYLLASISASKLLSLKSSAHIILPTQLTQVNQNMHISCRIAYNFEQTLCNSTFSYIFIHLNHQCYSTHGNCYCIDAYSCLLKGNHIRTKMLFYTTLSIICTIISYAILTT